MMLLQKAQQLGLTPTHLTPSSLDPACKVSGLGTIGDPKDATALKNFVKNLDVLTFESEFYDAAYLKKELQDFKGYIFPSLDALACLQDRKTQKESFAKNKLTTSPFINTNEQAKIIKFFEAQSALVAKKRWNGYDGYGTFLLRSKSDLENFLQQNSDNLSDFIFEKLISFDYEVALQASRSRRGHTVFFPLVKTIQKDNKCFLVEGPLTSNPQLQKSIQKFLNKMDYVGTIGFEFFKTKKGLILNEVAPRVHNTGHHTLDSCSTDQFTMHILCGLQDKLPTPTLKTKSFVMLNLIGKSTNDVEMPDQTTGGALFWYGKQNRQGRKLGHINFVGENKKALVARAFKELKAWKL